MKIYIASSWKNPLYNNTKSFLQEFGYHICDWQDPKAGGFRWQECTDKPKEDWTAYYYRDLILEHERAQRGFSHDKNLMLEADCCVLLLPCGRSAHLEAGWFVGQGKPLFIYIPVFEEPELMYKFANSICLNLNDLIVELQALGAANA